MQFLQKYKLLFRCEEFSWVIPQKFFAQRFYLKSCDLLVITPMQWLHFRLICFELHLRKEAVVKTNCIFGSAQNSSLRLLIHRLSFPGLEISVSSQTLLTDCHSSTLYVLASNSAWCNLVLSRKIMQVSVVESELIIGYDCIRFV